jgi:hypothetical protein
MHLLVNVSKKVSEKDARFVAEYGAKVPYAIAKAAFPNRAIDNTNYDFGEVQVRNGG